MPRIHRLYGWVVSVFIVLAAGLSAAPLYASDIGYRVMEIAGSAELFDAISGAPKPFKTGRPMPVGSIVRTGSDGLVDLATDPYFESVLRIGPDSQVTFLSFLPVRIALDAGTLFVLKEEHDDAGRDAGRSQEVRVLTRHFLASLRQGGCILEVTRSGVTLKAFSESVRIQPKTAGGYSEVPFTVEEGFRYSKEGWERLAYPDYAVWQAWYKENNARKDKAALSR